MASVSVNAGGVVIIGNANVKRLDAATVARIYMGRVVEVDGVPVIAINANAGSAIRTRFLATYLNQDEDKYTAYWTVRRYIGKGAWPKEVTGSANVISYVNATPGAIGYIDEDDLKPGVNVLLR